MTDYQALCSILQIDPGKRGLLGQLPATDLAAVTDLLLDSERVIITSGFPVWGTGVAETDGPSGAANLAYALTELGKDVLLVTDPCASPIMLAAKDQRAPLAAVAVVDEADPDSCCRSLLNEFKPDLVIALERPGMAADGHFHNMRGIIIDQDIASTEVLFSAGIPTIGIGDGGNELGMGCYRSWIEATVPPGDLICANQPSTYPLAAGVSNWWGWGLAALLSARTGKELLPSDEEETSLLEAVLAAGGLDGVTKESTLSVDNLTLAQHLEILNQVRGWLKGE